MNVLIDNRFVHYCEVIGTKPLQEFQQNNNESQIQNIPEGENQTSRVEQDRCPTTVLLKFIIHQSINLIRLKETAKLHTQDGADDE